METLDNHSIHPGYAVPEGFRTVGGWDSGSVEEILGTPWDAMKRPTVFSGSDFRVGPLGLCERELVCEGDDTAQLGIELSESLQIELGEAFRRELSLLNPA